jgi:hypothetical protein
MLHAGNTQLNSFLEFSGFDLMISDVENNP